MRRADVYLITVILALILSGCNLPASALLPKPTPAGTIRPTFVPAPTPAIKVDFKPFQDAGCKPDQEGTLRCPPNQSPFNRFGCTEIAQAPRVLTGLKPGTVWMLCTTEKSLEPGEYFYNQGCLVPAYVRYLLYQDRQFSLLKNPQELKARFDLLDNPGKALAYAVAVTGFQALYGLKDDNMRYLKPQISDTQVQAEAGGYQMNLYSFGVCGCGPHTMSLRIVHVDPQGNLAIDDPQPLWEDPTQDDRCVD